MKQLSQSCENIRLINNSEIFEKYNIITVKYPKKNNIIKNIPQKNSVLFLWNS